MWQSKVCSISYVKTFSIWGEPSQRFGDWIEQIEKSHPDGFTSCVVGCSDGKFVLPLARRGHAVVAVDIDIVALEGGLKDFPIHRPSISSVEYESIEQAKSMDQIPTERRQVLGLRSRTKSEGLESLVQILTADFYRDPPLAHFDFVFTSCSIQYKLNRCLPVVSMLQTLTNRVSDNGFLGIEYMLPLEDSHHWKSEHFFRSGQIERHFNEKVWEIICLNESSTPEFEAAHVERPQDHYHRLGYLFAKKRVRND